MAKTRIVSEQALRELIEAHAALSSWYFAMSGALRQANASAPQPSDAERKAFLVQVGADFPELADLASSIDVPRPYVPRPPVAAARRRRREAPTVIEPAQARKLAVEPKKS